jgi:hypothetical protein
MDNFNNVHKEISPSIRIAGTNGYYSASTPRSRNGPGFTYVSRSGKYIPCLKKN